MKKQTLSRQDRRSTGPAFGGFRPADLWLKTGQHMSSWRVTADKLAAHRYTLAVSVVAAALFALPGTAPSSDPMYALLTLAVIVGMLLTVRLAPNRPGGALVLLPAMVVDARFGLSALPMLAWAAIVTNLIRGVRGPRVISTAAHLVIAFAIAHVSEQAVAVLPGWLVFSAMFACVRLALWYLAERLDVTPPDPRAARPEILLSLHLPRLDCCRWRPPTGSATGRCCWPWLRCWRCCSWSAKPPTWPPRDQRWRPSATSWPEPMRCRTI